MSKIDDLVKEYTRTFKQNFPIFSLRTAPESDIITILENCIKDGKPYVAEYKKNTVQ